MIGEKIRNARVQRELSLAQVAEKAGISIATLSRIETEKQALDLDLFLVLTKILRKAPHDFLGGGDGEGDGGEPLAARISTLPISERTRLWRELTEERRTQRGRRTHLSARQTLTAQVDELVAQIEFLREEIESVRSRVRRRR